MYGLGAMFGILGVLMLLVLGGMLAFYLLHSAALYRMACNAGMQNPWLAWIPIARSYILGSLCDRAAYYQGGKRWNLAVVLTVVSAVHQVLPGFIGAGALARWNGSVYGPFYGSGAWEGFTGMFSSLAGFVVTAVFAFALYHLYKDYAPGQEVLFTVLSVIFSSAAPAIILFMLRNRVPVSVTGYGPPPPGYQGYPGYGPPPPPGYDEPRDYGPPPGGPEL